MANKSKKIYLYPITFETHKEGGFHAKCFSLQGAWADGDTIEEATENLKDVIKHILEYRRERNKERSVGIAIPAHQAKVLSDLNVAVYV